jgi:hypothetical protein
MEPVHSLCLIEGNDGKGYPDLYDKIATYTSQNYAVIYAVEKDPTRAVQNMRRYDIEVEDLVESRALTIIGRNTMYSIERTGLEGRALLNSWHDVMLKVRKASDFKGMLAIGSVEAFFDHHVDPCKLVEYEGMVGKKFHIPFEGICCYSENAINNLSLGHMASILNSHYSTIHRAQPYKTWQPERILELTCSVVARELGPTASDLIFAAMKRNSDAEEREVAVLENTLKARLGKPAADIVLGKIKQEVRKFIQF